MDRDAFLEILRAAKSGLQAAGADNTEGVESSVEAIRKLVRKKRGSQNRQEHGGYDRSEGGDEPTSEDEG